MKEDRKPSEQRYFKLARIVRVFDDPLRAIEILLNVPDDSVFE